MIIRNSEVVDIDAMMPPVDLVQGVKVQEQKKFACGSFDRLPPHAYVYSTSDGVDITPTSAHVQTPGEPWIGSLQEGALPDVVGNVNARRVRVANNQGTRHINPLSDIVPFIDGNAVSNLQSFNIVRTRGETSLVMYFVFLPARDETFVTPDIFPVGSRHSIHVTMSTENEQAVTIFSGNFVVNSSTLQMGIDDLITEFHVVFNGVI